MIFVLGMLVFFVNKKHHCNQLKHCHLHNKIRQEAINQGQGMVQSQAKINEDVASEVIVMMRKRFEPCLLAA